MSDGSEYDAGYLRAVFEESPLGIGLADRDGRIIDSNPAYQRMLGYAADELRGMLFDELAPASDAETNRAAFEAMREGRLHSYKIEKTYQRKNGELFPVRVTSRAVRDASGVFQYSIGIVEDLTEAKRAERDMQEREATLRESQKMEAIGQLAGGVAHEFNNLLTVIMAHADFLRDGQRSEAQWNEDLNEIADAARDAADLTRQLLAFGRKQILQARPMDLGDVIRRLAPMLRHMLGDDVEFRVNADTHLPMVNADPGQIEQVLVNLVVNARDAMPNGGTLTIASHFTFPESGKGGPDAGRAIRIGFTVSDTGVGMEPEVAARSFEPFFTTKAPGQGVGLGLSTAYGIVTQSGGTIAIDSAPNRGARVTVLFPATRGPKSETPTERTVVPFERGQRILLVEDELAVRRAAVRILARNGYEVIEACSGRDALKRLDACRERISLLVTDIVMPAMNGRELAEAVLQRRPSTAVLFMSGYTDDEILRRGLLSKEMSFLRKPFTPEAFLGAVRQRLAS